MGKFFYWGESNKPKSKPSGGWLPFTDPDNGLTPAQERDYARRYDEKVRRLRAQGPEGKRAAEEFMNEEQRKYHAWRKAAKQRQG